MKSKLLLITCLCLILNNFQLLSQTTTSATTDPYGLEKPLFQVKNRNQQTVFAVYSYGVKIYIDDKLKTTGGGFTVGRLGTGKSTGSEYFVVNPNDVQVILNETTQKAAGGGFTVGRLGTGKSTFNENYLKVTPDQTRISVNDSVAGFAITNNVNGTSENILYLNKQNYFIGHNTGTAITSGIYNSTFGYQAGKDLSTGMNNLFLGYQSGFMNVSGNDNIFIGNKAGENSVSASFNTYLGSGAGRKVTGGNNTFIGSGAGTISSNAANTNNVFVGFKAGGSSGANKLENGNVCVGYMAGYNKSGSNKLFIANSDTNAPLIYGEFDNNKVTVNGSLNVTGNVSLNNNLSLTGSLTVNNDLSVNNNLTVANNLQSKNLLVTVDLSVNHNLTVSNNLNVNNDLVVTNNLSAKSLTVTTDLAVNNNLQTKNLTVTNDIAANHDLTVANNLLANNLTVTGTFTSPSDMRLKTNLVQIGTGLELIHNLNAYYYDWNSLAKEKYGFSDKKQIGLLAQEVETVMPELVSEINGYKSVDYLKIVPILVNAVNEQQSIIEQLKSDMAQMKLMIEKLSNK